MKTYDLPESEESLLALAAPPLVWAAHFVLSYGTAAVYCAKVGGPDGSLGSARVAVAIYTLVALGTVVFFGVRGHRRHQALDSATAHDDDSPIARHRFLGFVALLLSGLSALAILYGALVFVFVRSCR